MQQDSPMREDIPPPEGPGAILAPTPAPAGEPQEAPDAGTATIMQKASWGSSAVTDQLMGNGIGSLAMPIYNITLGVSPELLGWALAIPRVFDAVIDPLIGNLSGQYAFALGTPPAMDCRGGDFMRPFLYPPLDTSPGFKQDRFMRVLSGCLLCVLFRLGDFFDSTPGVGI